MQISNLPFIHSCYFLLSIPFHKAHLNHVDVKKPQPIDYQRLKMKLRDIKIIYKSQKIIIYIYILLLGKRRE